MSVLANVMDATAYPVVTVPVEEPEHESVVHTPFEQEQVEL